MILDDDIDLGQVTRNGGTVTVFMGTGFNAPTAWSLDPRVHWVTANTLTRGDVPGKIPTSTHLVIFTDNISAHVIDWLHAERVHRKLPYIVRKSGEGVDLALNEIFPRRPPIQVGPANPPEEGADDDMAKKAIVRGRGQVKAFIEEHADFSNGLSYADEARRLLPIAKREKVQTTENSLAQGIRVVKMERDKGKAPATAVARGPLKPRKAEGDDYASLGVAIDAAMTQLASIKVRASKMDDECGALRKENTELKTKFAQLQGTFQKLLG